MVGHTGAITWWTRRETFKTRSVCCNFYILRHAGKNFIECEIDDVAVVRTRAVLTLVTTEHLFEYVTHVRSLLLRWTIVAKLVVTCTRIRICQCFVGLINFFEFIGITGLFIRMVNHGEFTVRLFDFVDCRISLNTQNFVVVRHIYCSEVTFM